MENEVNWRHFPAIEEIFQNGRLAEFLAQCGETCQRLNEIAKGPDARLAARAQSAMSAYGHTIQLLNRLAEAATQAAEAR